MSSEVLKISSAAFIWARYLPVISLGRGTQPGQGTCPSTSHMHSFRQYFFGPKLAGFEATILARASACSTSLERQYCRYLIRFMELTVSFP
ncbi:hypothetical protein JZ751_010081 [Albula glossodonta]|uniref:Uncharacterized protein n=1 Tax=Albula glossodonta TaxID=121402 RepID=A0A8T2N7X8_9TELE|nr:hypothetical protein JZ751_010081 [Albula glossodonta]